MSLKMALRASVAAVFVGGCMTLFPAFAPVASADELQSAGAAEEARAAMSRMSRTLQATQFSFNARTLRTYVGPNGQLLHVAHAIKTVFRRPDRSCPRPWCRSGYPKQCWLPRSGCHSGQSDGGSIAQRS